MKQPKAVKPLSRKQYMAQFSRSARWRLGAADAAEPIRDYREMVGQEEREEAKLVEELGDPVQAAWLLTDAREFKRWRWVFGILVCCALFVANWNDQGLPIYWKLWHPWFSELWMEFVHEIIPLALGLILAVIWFRREKTSGPMPKPLLLALAAVVLAAAVVLVQVWRCFDVKWVITDANGFGTHALEYGMALRWAVDAGALISLVGAVGVPLARCYDRRWAALFVLCLAVGVLCLMCQYVLLGMNPEAGIAEMRAARTELFCWLAPVGLAGLAGTGVLLK